MMNTSVEKESIQQQPQIEKQFDERVRELDLHDSYMYFRNYTADSPIVAFTVVKKCVEFGKELLPVALEDAAKQKAVTALHVKACKTLVDAAPGRRTVTYGFQDFGSDRVIPIYKIAATDAGGVEAREEELDKLLQNFVSQQYEQHMRELQEVDNLIFHELVLHEVIETKVLTIDEILNDQIKLKMKARALALNKQSKVEQTKTKQIKSKRGDTRSIKS